MARTARMIAGLAAVVGLAAPALVACSQGENPSAGVTGTITVLAAASLTDVFEEIGTEFEAANPGSNVEFSFAGSSQLAAQINEGSPADVFASASTATMKTVTDAGTNDSEPVTFVKNQLVIAVEKGNPNNIQSLQDLTKPGVTVVLCAEEVPCGAASKTAIESANLTITPVSFEQNVRDALGKVGEADAALVYRTDAAVDDQVEAVDFAESASALQSYQIATLKDAPNADGAAAFVAWVLSDKGAAKLDAFGFQQPQDIVD